MYTYVRFVHVSVNAFVILNIPEDSTVHFNLRKKGLTKERELDINGDRFADQPILGGRGSYASRMAIIPSGRLQIQTFYRSSRKNHGQGDRSLVARRKRKRERRGGKGSFSRYIH